MKSFHWYILLFVLYKNATQRWQKTFATSPKTKRWCFWTLGEDACYISAGPWCACASSTTSNCFPPSILHPCAHATRPKQPPINGCQLVQGRMVYEERGSDNSRGITLDRMGGWKSPWDRETCSSSRGEQRFRAVCCPPGAERTLLWPALLQEGS